VRGLSQQLDLVNPLVWEFVDVAPVAAGPAFAVSSSWDGAPAWFSGGPDGVRVLAADGSVVVSSDVVHPVALVVRQLDGVGEDEVVACGPEGIALLRGNRQGVALPRPLSDEPCSALAAYDLETYPGLASISDGELVMWTPGRNGLDASPTGIRARVPPALVSLGRRVAVVTTGGDVHLTAPSVPLDVGPVTAISAAGTELVWVGAAGAPWSGGEALPEGVTGVVAGAGTIWFLDAVGGRLRTPEGPWVALPIRPVSGVVSDQGGDGCPELWLTDGAGGGAIATGRCVEAPTASPVAPLPAPVRPDPLAAEEGVPRAPAEVVLSASGWAVVNVRAGELLDSRVSWGDGQWWRWSKRGGPPGLSITEQGTLDYQADSDDVGRWRASLRSGNWPRSRFGGVEVRVWPNDTPMGAPTQELVPVTPPLDRASEALRVWFGAGVAGGFATTDGSRWESLGEAPTGAAISPFAAGMAEVRLAGPVALWTGFDSAPLFAYPAAPDRRTHVAAATLGLTAGSDTLRLGPYGTYGYSLRGLGGRVAYTPFGDARGHATGPELRVTWLTPQIGVEAALSWVWEL
jgi:hypothetical protein